VQQRLSIRLSGWRYPEQESGYFLIQEWRCVLMLDRRDAL
jgi:hypothetical protein